MHLNQLTIRDAHAGLKNREFTARELVADCLEAIKEKNHEINAFITVFEESAMEAAKKVDEKIVAGVEIGALEGIPFAIKDNILIEGTRATAGSKILENYISAYDATVIKRLKAAGAIFVGKTNMDEFAMGSSTETSHFGPTKNPVNTKMVPGGSSGGSAAAVAADMCLAALGSDTGGSVRQPASLCGIVGLKPSYGRVSRHGLMAMASSLDQISPFAKTVADAELIYKTIAGSDAMDSTAVEMDLDLDAGVDISKLKIGLPKEYFSGGLDSDIAEMIREKARVLQGLGAKIIEVSLPHTEYALPVYYVIMPSEVSSNLARYDGIRYGYSAHKDSEAGAKNLYDVYAKSRAKGFGDEVRRRIMIGAYALSSGYYDAYYKKAAAVRAIIRREYEEVLKTVDCLITPTSPSTAWPIGEKMNDPLKMYLSDIFTVSANVCGIPAISVPAGEKDGLPVGLQIMGKQFDENTVLRVAKHLYA
jgi:aspartyl-tRNA(Asn)/glutamyl-tRNA(Gln) amidotransferase subunit A